MPLIYFENSPGGRNFPKELLLLGGIIRLAAVRTPVPASWDEPTRQRAHALARQFDLLLLRSPAGHRSVAGAGQAYDASSSRRMMVDDG